MKPLTPAQAALMDLQRRAELAERDLRRAEAERLEALDRAQRAEKQARDAWRFARAICHRPDAKT